MPQMINIISRFQCAWQQQYWEMQFESFN